MTARMRRRNGKAWALGVVASVALSLLLTFVAVGVSGTHGAGAGDVPAYCNATLPRFSLHQCEATHSQMQSQAQKLWPSKGRLISRAQAAIATTTGVKTVTGQSVYVVATYEYETTYGNAGNFMEAPNPFISSSTPVWIVTQHWSGPIMTRNGYPGLRAPPANWNPPTVSTMIIDAVTGSPIDSCVGCDVVGANGQPSPVGG